MTKSETQLTIRELKEKLTTEIWEAINGVGADPESQEGQDVINFRVDSLTRLFTQALTEMNKDCSCKKTDTA